MCWVKSQAAHDRNSTTYNKLQTTINVKDMKRKEQTQEHLTTSLAHVTK